MTFEQELGPESKGVELPYGSDDIKALVDIVEAVLDAHKVPALVLDRVCPTRSLVPYLKLVVQTCSKCGSNKVLEDPLLRKYGTYMTVTTTTSRRWLTLPRLCSTPTRYPPWY